MNLMEMQEKRVNLFYEMMAIENQMKESKNENEFLNLQNKLSTIISERKSLAERMRDLIE